MYQVLIVDDERIERNGMKLLLKQTNLLCEVAEATNGVEALAYMREHPVDILLTDVKMPFMDGITLIQEAQKLNREIRYVIFSGCNEFDYARQAIRLGVANYILKPVDPDEFCDTINRVANQLEQLRQERKLREKSTESAKEHALYQIVNGADVEKVMEQTGMILQKRDLDCYCRMILMEFDRDFFGIADQEFLQKVLGQEGVAGCRYLNLNQQQALLLYKDAQLDYIREAGRIHQLIQQQYQEICHLAISSPIEGAAGLSAAAEELELLMENKFYHSDCPVYYQGMDQSRTNMIQLDDDTLMKQMKQDIRMKDIQGLREHFDRFAQKYRNQTAFSQIYVKFLFSNLLKDIYDCLPSVGEEELNREIDILYRASDFSKVMKLVQKNIDLLSQVFSGNSSTMHREVEIVKQYIYAHFGEELSADRLGELVYLAPSYLSSVFKKETGQNLSKFVKTVRMEKARQMLAGSMQKIVDISTACGYPNVSYFCSSFREYFGISPQKFRESGENNIEG